MYQNTYTALTEENRSPQWTPSTIAAQVFLNYFFSIQFLIREDKDALNMLKSPYFNNFNPRFTENELQRVIQHLHNAWNTEYALRASAQVGTEGYLRNALHWTFPQAYYSIYESLQAFLALQGWSSTDPDRLQQQVSRLMVRRAYPEVVSYYAAGHPLKPSIHRLPNLRLKASLELADDKREAQAQIAQFLRTTRRQKAQQIRKEIQRNPQTALRSVKSGVVLKRFTEAQWGQIATHIGYTTLFSLLSRLLISANHREITRFVEADIDFRLFHESLQNLVSYLNFVHETYVVKAIGIQKYQELIQDLPSYLKHGFVEERFEQERLSLV